MINNSSNSELRRREMKNIGTILSLPIAISCLFASGLADSAEKAHGDVCTLPGRPPDFTAYMDDMRSRFRRNLPDSYDSKNPVTVRFFVTSDGFIRDAVITKSSGNTDWDTACLDAVYASSPLPPPPLFREIPPPPPAGLVLPPSYFGTGIYLFTFQKEDDHPTKPASKFEYLLIPREVVFRYPGSFSLIELQSSSNKIELPPLTKLEDARFQWAQFYKDHRTASRDEIINWSKLISKFYLENGTASRAFE